MSLTFSKSTSPHNLPSTLLTPTSITISPTFIPTSLAGLSSYIPLISVLKFSPSTPKYIPITFVSSFVGIIFMFFNSFSLFIVIFNSFPLEFCKISSMSHFFHYFPIFFNFLEN